MAYWIYNSLLTLCSILLLPALPFVFLLGKRAREGFLQRLGFYPAEVSASIRGTRAIWIHAVSVGEVLSARNLAARLKEKFPGRKIVLSTFTSTGSSIGRRVLASVDAVIYLPLDYPWIVRRTLRRFDPSILIFLETEIWPNLLRSAYQRGIPTVVLSGRLSPRAFKRYFMFRLFFSRVVRQFTAIGMQSEADAERMVRLGVDRKKVWITGSLKHVPWENGRARGVANGKPGLNFGEREKRKLFVAGSTHRGEEEIMVDAFLSLKISFPGLAMVLAPRHPQRFGKVEQLLQNRGVGYEKKSHVNGRERIGADVLLLDTLGDLASLYAIADVALVGGSLVDAGGHNLIEPAQFRKPVLFGPHMTNFADIAGEMKRQGGGIEVRGKEDIIREVSSLLANPEKAEKIGDLAYGVVREGHGVVERSIDLVSRYVSG